MKKNMLSIFFVLCMVLALTSYSAFAEGMEHQEDTAGMGEFLDGTFSPNEGNAEADELSTDNLVELAVAASNGTCGENLTWSLDSTGTLTISGTGKMDDWTEHSSPSPWRYRKDVLNVIILPGVTSIGTHAFNSCSLISVSIPESVQSIGDHAFWDCYNLTSLTIPASLRIERGSFRNNSLRHVKFIGSGNMVDYTSYEAANWELPWRTANNEEAVTVEIGDGITSIGAYTFCDCTISISIPNSVSHISNSAFDRCDIIGDIALPYGVSVGDCAFRCSFDRGPSSLGEVTIANVGAASFSGCNGLTTVTILPGATNVPEEAFSGCTNLSHISIPDSVENIGHWSFRNCNSLSSLTIPNSVTSIEREAFVYCSGLKELSIPATVCTEGRFSNCTELSIVKLTGQGQMSNYHVDATGWGLSPWHISSNAGNCISVEIQNGITSIGDYAFLGCSGLISVTIPDSISSIGTGAFSNCNKLTSLDLPNSVTSIGDSAFRGCIGLAGVLSIPTSATTIGNYAFQNCTGFTGSLIIPNNVTTLGDYAFSGCTNLTGSLVIGNGITEINSNTFYGCKNFKGSLTIGTGIKRIGNSTFSDFNSLTGKLLIPTGVTEIGAYAFSNCAGVTGSLIIPNSVTALGDYAFSGCTNLSGSLIIGNGITEINSNTFYGCENFKGSLTIGNGLKRIGDRAFSGFSNLAGSLTIPDSVIEIGSSAFSNCIGFSGGLKLSKNLQTIGSYAFANCSGLSGNITIFGSIDKIGDYAFSGCTRLTSVIIPDSVTSIGDYTFYHCNGFSSVTIPASVTSIGMYAFEGCNNITDIYYGGTKIQWNTIPIATGNSVLSDSTVTIHYIGGNEDGNGSNAGGYQIGFDSTLWSSNAGVVFYYDANEININGKTYTYSDRVSLSNLNISIGCHVSYLLDTNREITGLIVLKRDIGTLVSGEYPNTWKVNGYTYYDSTHGSNPQQYLNQDVSVYYYTSSNSYAAQIIPFQVEIGTITDVNVDSTLHKASLTMGGTTYPVSPGLYATLPESQYAYYMGKNDAVLEVENGEIVKIQLLSDYWSEPSVYVKIGETPTFELNGGIFNPSQQSLEVHFSYGTSNCPTKVRNALRANVENNVTLNNVSVTSASQYIKISLETSSTQLLRFEDSVSWKFSVSPIASWTNVGQITEVLPLNITATYTLNGSQKSCFWEYSGVVLKNKGLLKAQEEKDNKNSNSAASDAANKLEALMGSKKVTIGTIYRPFGLSNKDARFLEESIITQVLLYETPKKTWIKKLEEKIDNKILSKVFGNYSSIMDAGTNVLELDYIIENCRLGVSFHDYGSQCIRITCTMSEFKLMDKSYSGIIDLDYRVLGPTDTKRGEYVPAHLSEGTLGGITIIDMQAFADGVYSVAATELKSAYNKALDAAFSLFPNELFSETTQKIFDKVTSKTTDIGWKAVTHAAKSGSVKCPVNVYIYDNEGILCGAIEDNEVVLLNGPFQLWVEEDFKYFSNVPYDYQIEYVATANGTMTVEMTEYIDSSTALRSLSFSVPLYGNVLYTQQSPEQICGDTAQYIISSGTDLVCTVEDESYLLQFDSSDVQMLGLVGQTDGISCEVVLQLSNGGNSNQTAAYFIAIYGEDGKLLNLTEDEITMAANAAENRFYQLAANEPIAYAKAFMLDDDYAPLSEYVECQFTSEDALLFDLIDMP